MSSTDLLDAAEALLLRPLQDHPEQMEKFRQDVLFAPLEGSRTSKIKAQTQALSQFGMDMGQVDKMMKARRAAKAEAEAAKAAAS